MVIQNPIIFSLLISVVFNLIVFLIAFKLQTDKLTDITYSATFSVIALVLLFANETHTYRYIVAGMVLVWALRLGSYLLRRVIIKGKDDRFDSFRSSFTGFGKFFLLQAISIWIVALPFILALSSTAFEAELAMNSMFVPIGIFVFMVGWLLETIADAQKFKFRADKSNHGKFMGKGLFSLIRFPNYAGEILVWTGMFIISFPVMENMELLSIISPIWIIILLIKISGIPFLEASNKERYGHLEAFEDYKQNTKKLIPWVY